MKNYSAYEANIQQTVPLLNESTLPANCRSRQHPRGLRSVPVGLRSVPAGSRSVPIKDGIQLATRRVPCPQMGRLFALAILVQPMDLSYERRLELSAHSILEKHKAPDQFPSIIPFRFVL